MKTKIIALFLLSLAVMSCSSTKSGKQTMTTFDRNVQPKPGPAPKVNLKKPKTFTLDNGLKVLVVENHKLPRASASLSIDNPPIFEGEKAGVARITGALLGTGTSSISKEDFNETVDFLGASVSFGSQSARVSALSKYFLQVFALMANAAIDPKFTQEEFDKEIAKALDNIKSGEKSVATIASRVENALSYGRNHPYGEFTTMESLKKLTLDDVKKFYTNYYKPNNAYLVIVGDVDFDETKAFVEQNFSAWEKGTIPSNEMPNVQNVTQTEINFIDMPNASQSQVNVMNMTKLEMTDPDYHAVLVANQIFGGDFNSHLNMNLREAHGYTYGARSGLRPNRYISRFKAGAQVRNEVADSTVVEIIKELNRIRTEKVTAEELNNVKASYAGKFVMGVEKPQNVARYALNIEKYKLPSNFYKTFLQKINAVTADDVLRVAQKYFSVDNTRIVVTSKGSDVVPALEKLGYPIHYFDKEGNPTEKPKMSKKVSSSITPQTVIDNFIKAIGGKAKLQAINSIEMTEEMTAQGMTMEQTTKQQNPNLMQIEVKMMGQVAGKIVFDGKEGSMFQMGREIPLPEDQLEKIQSKKGVFDILYVADTYDLSLEGIEPVNDNDCYKMLLKKGEKKKYYYYDVTSNLLVKIEEEELNPATGKSELIPTYYSDYKEVDGILFSHKKTTSKMGTDVEMKVTKVEFNKEFPAGTFSK